MEDGLSLYLHIPFCERKCLYCDFLSFHAGKDLKERYVDALIEEMDSWRRAMAKRNEGGAETCIKSIFIGGGTPTCLDPRMLLKIGDEIFGFAAELGTALGDAEFTIEANPGTVLKEHIAAFKGMGINRISLGLQSAHDGELKRLGRIHCYNDFLECYAALREAGFENINIDVMTGIPGQSVKSCEDTLKKVISLRPEHISAYGLMLEPGTPFYEMDAVGELDLPDDEQDRRMYHMAKRVLKDAGYERYEISNFAAPGRECAHNNVYWTGGDYLGLGLGASSYLRGIRFANTSDMEKYIAGAASGADIFDSVGFHVQIEKLTKENRIEEFMFLGLRRSVGVSRREFKKRFDVEMDELYACQLDKFLKNGILDESEDKDRVYLTDRGIDVSNMALADFLID